MFPEASVIKCHVQTCPKLSTPVAEDADEGYRHQVSYCSRLHLTLLSRSIRLKDLELGCVWSRVTSELHVLALVARDY